MPQTPSILLIDSTSTFGGAFNSLKIFANNLNQKKYIPIIISGQSKSIMSDAFEDKVFYQVKSKSEWLTESKYKIILTAIRCKHTIIIKKIIVLCNFIFSFFMFTLPLAYQYYKIGKKHKVSLVHLNNIFVGQLSGIIAAKLLRVPCVAHLRCYINDNKIIRFCSRFIDHHIAISSSIKDNLLKLDIKEDKISLVFDGIPLIKQHPNSIKYLYEEFNINNKTKVFSLFGRLIKWKGITEFIQAAEKVLKNNSNTIVFIVGDVSDGDQNYFTIIKDLINELNLNNKIIMTGFRKDISSIMQLSDVILNTSVRPEPFGLVLIEAMAASKPTIAFNHGGPQDIIMHNETGFLVEPGNIEDLTNAINILLNNNKLSHSMGLKGKLLLSKKFNIKQFLEGIENVYVKIIH